MEYRPDWQGLGGARVDCVGWQVLRELCDPIMIDMTCS